LLTAELSAASVDDARGLHVVVLRGPGASDVPAFGAGFDSWEAFAATSAEPLAFYLRGWDDAQRQSLVERVRRSPWWDRPVWADEAGASAAWLDGQGRVEQARQAGERALAVRRSLAIDPAALYFDERVLYFLAQREGAELLPVCDRHSRELYRDPVLECLAREAEDAGAAVTALVRRGLLEPSRLIDRTRHCRSCGSAHLHYFDVCPHCSSIQIHRSLSLHCFTCGHVAPEADFRGEAGLSCPKCSARLRHIGVDYDRPLTQFACASCHHVFVESSVVVRCLDCATTAEPSDLEVREVSALRLSAHGRAALRAGQVKESMAALDSANYVVPSQFRQLVDWALAAQSRHAQMRFSLMMVEFLNAAEFVERHGAARAYLMLDEFARRLHELLRSSDVTTRTAEERLWLFLPFSHAPGLAARVEALLAQSSAAGAGDALRARITWLAAPEDLRSGDNCERLMQRLAES
jgi:GGDEF domain-containing protein